jgi:hypothetical protein
MKRWKGIFAVFVLLLCVSGCAGSTGYIPKHAMMDGKEAISLPNPEQMRKTKGDQTFILFDIILPQELLPEFVAFKRNGVVQANGIWPLISSELAELAGVCWYSRTNTFLDKIATCMVPGKMTEAENKKLLLSNRDGGWLYDLKAKKVVSQDKKDFPFSCDLKKFDTDPAYHRQVVEENGNSIKEHEIFSQSYLAVQGSPEFKNALEIIPGADSWDYFTEKWSEKMPANYVMKDGTIRSSYLDEKQFLDMAVELSDHKYFNRYFKRAKLPLAFLPLLATPIGYLAGAIVVGDAMAAGIDDNLHGNYLRAATFNYKMAALLSWQDEENKKINEQKNKTILKLKKQLETHARGE